jgi:hypothetical protein
MNEGEKKQAVGNLNRQWDDFVQKSNLKLNGIR